MNMSMYIFLDDESMQAFGAGGMIGWYWEDVLIEEFFQTTARLWWLLRNSSG